MIQKQFYTPAYLPDGSALHDPLAGNMSVLYWNDECWNRCVPADTSGLSYLEVGHGIGAFLLRFHQRGGHAIGLEPDKVKWVEDCAEEKEFVGREYEDDDSNFLRSQWYPNGDGYEMRYGGFGSSGKIVPNLERKFSIAASFNVIEYLRDPKACVQALQSLAVDRVLIATDTAPETHDPNTPPLRFRTSVKDLVSYFSWPCEVCVFDGGPIHGEQAFICATNPESKLKLVSLNNIDTAENLLTATQREWLKHYDL